jgi:O-antigen/teichoic acid export membrane protein
LRWRPALLPEFARLGGPLVLSAVSYFVIHFSDRVFLNHAVSRDASGRYWLAYNFAMLLSILVGDSFAKAWNVSFYRYAEDPGWRTRFARVARWLVLVLGTAAVAIALFGDDALRIMVPPAYRAPTLLIAILVFGYVFREVGDFFLNLMMLDRRSGTIGRLAAASAVLNLALNLWLIPSHGLYGAALATLLTWGAYLIACWRVAQRQHRLPFPVRPALGLLIAGLAAVGIAATLPVAHVTGSILMHAAFLLGFAAFAWIAYLTGEERREVRGFLLFLKKKKQKDF